MAPKPCFANQPCKRQKPNTTTATTATTTTTTRSCCPFSLSRDGSLKTISEPGWTSTSQRRFCATVPFLGPLHSALRQKRERFESSRRQTILWTGRVLWGRCCINSETAIAQLTLVRRTSTLRTNPGIPNAGMLRRLLARLRLVKRPILHVSQHKTIRSDFRSGSEWLLVLRLIESITHNHV